MKEYPLHKAVSQYTQKALKEAYVWEKDLRTTAKLILSFQTFVLFVLFGLETLVYFMNPGLFPYSVMPLFIILSTSMVSALLALLSQWRMYRMSFADSKDIIDLANSEVETSTPNTDAVETVYAEIIQMESSAEHSVNDNNRHRTRLIHASIIICVITVLELLVFSLLLFIH